MKIRTAIIEEARQSGCIQKDVVDEAQAAGTFDDAPEDFCLYAAMTSYILNNEEREHLFRLTGIIVRRDGWGNPHSDDGKPSAQFSRSREWHWRGQLHRDNGMPAVIRANGRREWFEHGVCYAVRDPSSCEENFGDLPDHLTNAQG